MEKRTIDLLTESYKDQMTARRKYEFKDANGVVKANLYFKPLTRDDRVRAQGAANTDDALTLTIMQRLLGHPDAIVSLSSANRQSSRCLQGCGRTDDREHLENCYTDGGSRLYGSLPSGRKNAGG